LGYEDSSFSKPDEEINAISERYFSGGVNASFLVAASRLGVSCGFIGAIGDDLYGDFLIQDVKKEKIDTKFTLKKKEKNTCKFHLYS
jgi:sugar/nucleoside kinase (ribokinase family)